MKRNFIIAILLCLCCLFASCESGGTNTDTGEDMKKNYPFYVDADKAEYKFDFDETVTPFYLGNVIYNESVLMMDDEEGTLTGKLQFTPKKILSVRDFTLKKEYDVSLFKVNGKVMTAKSDSGVTSLTAKNLAGIELPEGFNKVSGIGNILTDCVQMGAAVYTESPFYYGKQVYVSYVYDVKELNGEVYAQYKTSGLQKTKNKLILGDDVKIVATGDSVMEGCSSSKNFNREPFMDNFMELTRQALDKKYEGNVTLANLAVGGKTSGWGAETTQTIALANENPDLMYIHFGINDLGSRVSAETYKTNIREIVTAVQGSNPDCEFVLIKAFAANPDIYLQKNFEEYWKVLDELSEELDNVYTLDMFTQSMELINSKTYYDVTGNGINHVNDFSARLYAMNMTASLIKY